MKMFSIILALVTLSNASFANTGAQMPLISIETEQVPGVTYTMGFDLDAKGNKVGMFYFDPTKGESEEEHFSFAALQSKPQVLINRSGYDVVKLSLKAPIVTISYQMDARKGIWSDKLLKVECDSTQKNCVIRDLDTGKTTNSLYVTNHTAYFGKVVVGVDAIESR